MSVLVVGLNHRTAEFPLLERVAVAEDELGKVLHDLTSLDHVVEAVVLSTCHRVEVYAHVGRFHAALDQLRGWLATRADVDIAVLDPSLYTHIDDGAAAHLFAVTSGIDSVVVGEAQIAAQVRAAADDARREGASRRVLQHLFAHAGATSRRVRKETDVSRGASSMVDLAIDVAVREAGAPLADRVALVLGAGAMGGLSAKRLRRDGVARLLVWNRHGDKAHRLAASIDGEVVAHDSVVAGLAAADLVICCTGARSPILDPDIVGRAMDGRPDRPILLLDLGMPRNVDPACAALPGVTVVDIDRLRATTDDTIAAPAVQAARAIVDEEAARFAAWTEAAKVEPTIRALRERAETVRTAELARAAKRLGQLEPRERDAVEALTKAIVATLLHEPTVRLKSLGERRGAEHYANAVRELFDLDE